MKFRPTPCPSKSSFDQFEARTPDVMEPPETLENLSIRLRYPSSLSRHRLPAWNSIARYPPPDRQSAIPSVKPRSRRSVAMDSTGEAASTCVPLSFIEEPNIVIPPQRNDSRLVAE